MSKKNIILGVIALVLILGTVLGVMAWVATLEELPSGSNDVVNNDSNNDSDNASNNGTSNGSGGNNTSNVNGGNDTSNNNGGNDTSSGNSGGDTSNSTPGNTDSSSLDIYQEGDIGYVTTDNLTTFFVEISAEDFTNTFPCENNYTVNVMDSGNHSYSLACKYSVDGGKTWLSMTGDGYGMYLCQDNLGYRVYFPRDQKILVAYTQKVDCGNPKEVFRDLQANVFTTKSFFDSMCCGVGFSYYDNFPIYMFHEEIVGIG